MKILKIFGVVVAVHAIAFIVMFANPGCRSTNATRPEAVIAAAPAPYPAGDEYVPVTAVNMDTASVQPAVGVQPEGRFTPTRPGAAADASAEIIPATTHVVQRGDSLWSIAKKHGISTGELASANKLSSNATLQIGQKLLVPSKGIASTDSSGSSSAVGGTTGYIVKSGDTLSTIARRHGTTITAIRSANSLRSDIVRVGQELRIPDGSTTPSAPVFTAPSVAASTPATGATTHVVKMGDSLDAISRRYKVSVTEIARANNITDPRRILIGQELVIPSPGSSSPATAAASTMQPAPAPVQTTPVQTVPTTAGDLDSALPPDFIDAPVIEVEDNGAPRIE